jgi:NADPH-dependent curcumin reductase CurA
MSSVDNHQWRLSRYVRPGEAVSADHFEWATASIPEPDAGEFVVRALFLAPGPAQRGYIEDRPNHFADVRLPLGEVMRGRGIGRVVASRHPDYHEGDYFLGSLGWQDYSLQKPVGKEFIFSTRRITKPFDPPSLHLGILGQAGATAYFGLQEAGRLRAGDNVLVSAAAGGVGSCAGQIARIKGAAKVVGLTGSDDKCAWLTNKLGFDAAVNYRTGNLDEQLTELFPEGIDVFFDNVGGEILDCALQHLAMHARIALAGYISTQYAPEGTRGPANYHHLIFSHASMNGFIFFDYWDRYTEAETVLNDWYRRGELINTETLSQGLEHMPAALAGLFSGANRGIAVCRV